MLNSKYFHKDLSLHKSLKESCCQYWILSQQLYLCLYLFLHHLDQLSRCYHHSHQQDLNDKLNQVAMKIQFQQGFKICMGQKVIE